MHHPTEAWAVAVSLFASMTGAAVAIFVPMFVAIRRARQAEPRLAPARLRGRRGLAGVGR